MKSPKIKSFLVKSWIICALQFTVMCLFLNNKKFYHKSRLIANKDMKKYSEK